MSDFLKSLVARQLGEAPTVRPRLAGRFEPPPDAFAPEAFTRAANRNEPDSEALELFLEVEAHDAPARDAREDSRGRAARHETDETRTRVLFVREPREESRPFSRHERSSEHDSERRRDAHSSPDTSDSRTQSHAREDDDARARPKSVVPSFDDEAARDSNERARAARTRMESHADEVESVRLSTQTRGPAPFDARARDARAPSPSEPREPSSDVEETQRPSTFARPSRTPTPARREADESSRASEESSSIKRIESMRARESEIETQNAAEARALREARRVRESSSTIEPKQAPPRERRAAARDTPSARTEVAPTINVTIGRVEVRATQAQASAPRRAEAQAPRVSLDEYLRRRSGEARE
jgi:hypothetical protein